MRLTAAGWLLLFLTGLTALSAATTGNNLLYLLYGAEASAFLLSWLAGRRNLRAVSASCEFPARIFRGSEFPLVLALRNTGRLPAFLLRSGGALLESLGAGEEGRILLRYRLGRRGLNAVSDLALESTFPFGLLRHRRALGPFTARAFPELREIHSAADISHDVDVSGKSVAKKGLGGELYGVREKDPSDDARLINWKLTAKSGRAMVNEYCGAHAAKITVRLSGVGGGEEGERRVSEAASAARFVIDAGAEVRVETPEGILDYGKGLLHLDAALELFSRLGEGKRPRPWAGAAAAPQAALADSPALRRLMVLGSLLVCASLFMIDEMNPRLITALLVVVVCGWLMTELKAPRLPKPLWSALHVAVLVFIVFFDRRFSGIVIANTHLLAYLLANRALEEPRTSELPSYFLILFLAFFLVSGLSISPWYFLSFIVYFAFAQAWLLMAQGLTARRLSSWAPALTGLLTALLVSSAAAFAATPRVERMRRFNPFVAIGLDKLQAQSTASIGFTEDVTLGFFGNLKKSQARVARVRPLGSWPEKPPPLLLRGAAYDQFDGRRWSKGRLDFTFKDRGRTYWTVSGRAWAKREGASLVFPAKPEGPGAQAFEFIFYPVSLSVLFTVRAPAAVEVPDNAAFFDYTGSAYFAAPYQGGLRYKVLPGGDASAGFAGAMDRYPELLRRRFLQLPEKEDPRIAALASRVAGGAASDEERAKRVAGYLRRTYSYSTYSDLAGRDLADFLFTAKKGNCEYFASAAAVLLRHAGIPSRLVTGFMADEYNEFGRFYDVRQGQAHAWVEAYAGGRWITLDPTPGQGFFSSDAFLRRFGRYVDAIQLSWYRNVIGYDAYVQRNTFFRVGRVFSWDAIRKVLRPALALAAAAAILLAGGWGAHRLLRRRKKAAGFFAAAQGFLERAGHARKPHWTPREYAGSVIGRRPDLEAVGPLAELHYLERYSPQGLSSEGEREARRLLALLRSRL